MKKKGKNAPPRPAAKPPGRRWLVPIDDGPLRQKTSAKCQRLMVRIEEARQDLSRFEKEDKAAFAQWVSSTFGAMLTELRENQEILFQKQELVAEVEEEVFISGRGYRVAYAEVLERRSRPPEEPESDGGPSSFEPNSDQAFDDDADDFDEDDLDEEIFRAFVRELDGRKVEQLSDTEYDDLRHIFETLGAGMKAGFKPPPPPQKKSVSSRLKELYRILVRRLHPDTKAEGETEVSALWHEVQQAYQQGNVERLEVLLAMTDLASQTAPEQTSLGQMRQVVVALERDLSALKRSLKMAKLDHAWNFIHRPDRAPLEARIRREMGEELADQRYRLAALDRQLKSWASLPAKKKKAPQIRKPAPAPKPPRPYNSEAQSEFGF